MFESTDGKPPIEWEVAIEHEPERVHLKWRDKEPITQDGAGRGWMSTYVPAGVWKEIKKLLQ